ncbi:HDOD domain-containing protein [Salinispirillum sp. LH 10-3-1]|uniref:HDOD domain-containing protein n=1 Tax=Salinispirillum sp. LH 10-3-1 TaxID=2952525 RepID=A0AB38YID7_9GAMM
MTATVFSIMVVDDDKMFTNSIRRTLNRLKPEWHFTLLTSPLEAQQRLEQGESPHVLLTDLLMPRLNGAELLAHAHIHSPLTLRALLTGFNDEKVLTHNKGVVHFLLAKPFTDDDILHLLDSTESLANLPLTLETRTKLGRLRDLPILPAIYNKLCTLLKSPDAGLEDMARLIEQDAYLSGRFLQIANSPFLGFSRSTLSVLEAANRLGARLICSMVLALQSHQQLQSLISPAVHKSIADAAFMQANLSRKMAAYANMGQKAADQVYMASLLGSLGRLMTSTESNQALLADATPESFATDAIVTAYLLTLWGFDSSLCQLILEQSAGDTTALKSDSAALVACAGFVSKGESPPKDLLARSVNETSIASLLQHAS